MDDDVVLDLTGPEPVWEVSTEDVIAWLEAHKGTLHDRLMAREAARLLQSVENAS